MNKKIGMSILISIFGIFVLIGSVYANYYYEYADPWYGTEFFDMNSNYYDSNSNQVVIEFFEGGSSYIDVYVPQNDYYLQNEIYGCILDQTYDSNANVATLKNEVREICQNYGIDNPNISVKSPYGDDSFVYLGKADGISMEPTIKDGSMLILNKTHDIHVGDIVSAEYRPKNIDILKRVSVINGDEAYLTSDNVNGTFVKNGKEYEYEGLRTWVNISDINGVLIDSYYDNNYNNLYYGDVIEV